MPIGVKPNHNKYQARMGTKPLGTYSTPEEAHIVYMQYKMNHEITIVNKYRERLSEDVYYALLAFVQSY